MSEDAVLELFFRLFKNSLNQFSAVRLLVFLVCINVNCSSVFNLTLLNVTTPLELTPGVFHKCQSISVMFWMRKKHIKLLTLHKTEAECVVCYLPPPKNIAWAILFPFVPTNQFWFANGPIRDEHVALHHVCCVYYDREISDSRFMGARQIMCGRDDIMLLVIFSLVFNCETWGRG